MKKSKRSSSQKSKLRYVIIAAIGLMVLGQLTLDMYAFARLSTTPGSRTADLILSALDDLYRPVVLDARTGAAFIYGANVTFPVDPTRVAQLKYHYVPQFEGSPAELQITDTDVMSGSRRRVLAAEYSTHSDIKQQQEYLFSQVPELQACSRGVHVVFQANASLPENGVLITQKLLADGRRVTMYYEKSCTANMTNLVDTVKQLQSY